MERWGRGGGEARDEVRSREGRANRQNLRGVQERYGYDRRLAWGAGSVLGMVQLRSFPGLRASSRSSLLRASVESDSIG